MLIERSNLVHHEFTINYTYEYIYRATSMQIINFIWLWWTTKHCNQNIDFIFFYFISYYRSFQFELIQFRWTRRNINLFDPKEPTCWG